MVPSVLALRNRSLNLVEGRHMKGKIDVDCLYIDAKDMAQKEKILHCPVNAVANAFAFASSTAPVCYRLTIRAENRT